MSSSASLIRRGDQGRGAENLGLLDYDEEDELDLEHDLSKVKVRGKKAKDEDEQRRPRGPPERTAEVEVNPGDTLQSLSLKYNVPVAEIKRVNNILNETSFFALKKVKIPVKAASILESQLLPAEVHAQGQGQNGWTIESRSPRSASTNFASSGVGSRTSETDLDLRVATLVDIGEGNSPGSVGNGVISKSPTTVTTDSKQTKKAKRFLKGKDKDLAAIREKNETLLAASANEDEDDLGWSYEESRVTSQNGILATLQSRGCIICVVVILFCIGLVLYLAKYELKVIQTEAPKEKLKIIENHEDGGGGTHD